MCHILSVIYYMTCTGACADPDASTRPLPLCDAAFGLLDVQCHADIPAGSLFQASQHHPASVGEVQHGFLPGTRPLKPLKLTRPSVLDGSEANSSGQRHASSSARAVLQGSRGQAGTVRAGQALWICQGYPLKWSSNGQFCQGQPLAK